MRTTLTLSPGAQKRLVEVFSEAQKRLVELFDEASLPDATPDPAPAPALVDRNGLAQALGCSVGTVNRLIRDGVPCVWLVDSRRFSVQEVINWLRARAKPGKQQ